MRSFAWGPLRVKQRVVFVPVSVRPPIDCDRFDVLGRIEPALSQYPNKLIANFPFAGFKRSPEQLRSSSLMLLAGRETGLAGSPGHRKQNRLLRRLRTLVRAEIRTRTQIDAGMIHARRIGSGHSELLERGPVPDSDPGVNQR